MATQIIELFEVQQWDGGERHNHDCYATTETVATEIAGQHGLVLKRKFVVHDTTTDYKAWKNGDIKRQAMAKLSPLEIAALGLENTNDK